MNLLIHIQIQQYDNRAKINLRYLQEYSQKYNLPN